MTPHHPSVIIHTRSDFNIHRKEWLDNSNRTDEKRKYSYDFPIASDQFQIVAKLAHVLFKAGYYVNLLDLLLTSFFDQCVGHLRPFIDSC